MNEHELVKFNYNMRVIRNSLDILSSEKLATKDVVQNEVRIIRNMIKNVKS